MRFVKLSLIPLLALLAAGCMEVDQELTINKDGSGQAKMHLAIDKDKLAMMEAMAKQGGGEGSVKSDFPLTEEDVRKQFADKKDVKLTDVKAEEKDGKRHIYYTLEAKNLAALFAAAEMKELSLSKDADGNYLLASPKREKPQEKPKTEQEIAMEKQMKAMMMPMLKGLKVSMKINTPSEILSTTAPQKTATSATWAYDIEKDASFLDNEPEFSVKFKGAGLNLPEIKRVVEEDQDDE